MNDRPHPASKEPLFNAPLLVFLVPAILIALYVVQSALQSAAGPEGEALITDAFALKPPLLAAGQYTGLLTHMFIHGSWLHVGMNAAALFAFSAPTVRACGKGLLGGLSFVAFYLVCGIVAGAGYCLLNIHDNVPVGGASGAISGIMAASIRLAGDPYDPPGIKPLTSPMVISMTIFFCGSNALIPVANNYLSASGLVIAWQDHIVGYLFGLLAISPWVRLFHRGYFTTK